MIGRILRAAAGLALALATGAAGAQGVVVPKEGQWVAKDFRFHTGETMPELRIHYLTIGDPKGEPVLILHGTAGSGQNLLSPAFAGELFGPGQPLDAAKHYIIIPDAIGAGKTTKPSDGLKARFPRYNYGDMVDAQYRLVSEGLGIKRLRLVLGNSMGGMHVWLWGVKYPHMMDALVPMACQPTPMAGRNWLTRRLIIDSIRGDPDWRGGEYTAQPKSAQFASVFFQAATNGGDQGLHRQAPNREKADALLDARLKAPFRGDANDILYQWDSSRDFDASAHLDRVQAHVLAINAADDERNPPSLGIMERELKRLKHARLHLIPASDQTSGHGTTGQAKWWKAELVKFLSEVPRK
ncbi:MAG: alpha/beta fold hydrolase [Betaproteobacteria bacterium]|nr:alpha/beta fold hydrolase [Betaproteobacteria bacterium]